VASGGLTVLDTDNDTSPGNTVYIGRNTDATYPAAGHLTLVANNGTAYYLWVDTTGDLRIHTNPPSNLTGVTDTGGTVVGTQT
jgi:hypothetical protein